MVTEIMHMNLTTLDVTCNPKVTMTDEKKLIFQCKNIKCEMWFWECRFTVIH